jgi:HSP20 family protein
VNAVDAGENLEVKAEVPGFSEKEIEVSVESGRLTITGKRETETRKEDKKGRQERKTRKEDKKGRQERKTRKEDKKGKTVYSESCSNQILRIVDLPASVDPEKTTATLKNGVLNLTIAKAAKAKTIEIKPKAA